VWGFYIFFDDYGVSYVGLVRSNEGLGLWLVVYVCDFKKLWFWFCWFFFDDVVVSLIVEGWFVVEKWDVVG